MDISNATNFRQILTHETVPLRFFVTKSLSATPSTFFRDEMILAKSNQDKMSQNVTKSLIATPSTFFRDEMILAKGNLYNISLLVTKSLIAAPSTFFRDDMNKQNTKKSRILPIAILLNLSYTKTFLATLRPHVSATKTYNHDILHLSHYNAR